MNVGLERDLAKFAERHGTTRSSALDLVVGALEAVGVRAVSATPVVLEEVVRADERERVLATGRAFHRARVAGAVSVAPPRGASAGGRSCAGPAVVVSVEELDDPGPYDAETFSRLETLATFDVGDGRRSGDGRERRTSA